MLLDKEIISMRKISKPTRKCHVDQARLPLLPDRNSPAFTHIPGFYLHTLLLVLFLFPNPVSLCGSCGNPAIQDKVS